MTTYDKEELKDLLDISNIFDLLVEFGGEPEYISDTVIVSRTICHNNYGEGSRKLYYYDNTKLFKCFTACDEAFDIMGLAIKVAAMKGYEWNLNDAISYIASFFGFAAPAPSSQKIEVLPDWNILERYQKLETSGLTAKPQLKPIDTSILNRFFYLPIGPWLKEGISPDTLKNNRISYYPVDEQIVIPHFDMDGNLIGIRGRFLSDYDAEKRGKYRPIVVNRRTYSHPLSANLYNLNNSKDNIAKTKAAVIFESEKSTLLYQTYYPDNDISCAICGSNISSIQIALLMSLGVREIIIALDRQFKEKKDDEFYTLVRKLKRIGALYSKYFTVSCIFDKQMITSYKASPIDEGKDKFEFLLKHRITL